MAARKATTSESRSDWVSDTPSGAGFFSFATTITGLLDCGRKTRAIQIGFKACERTEI